MKDYYYILGVKSNASSEIIRDAYRKLSKRFHPDINNGDKFLEERFKEINEAYETLSDDGKRRIYHEKLLRFNSKSGGNTNNDFENKKREEEFAAKKRAFETEKIRIEKEKRDLEAERAQFEFSKRGQNTNKNQNKTDNISNTNDAKYTSQNPKKIKDNDSNELKSILKFVEFLIPVIIFVGAFVYLKNEGYLDKKIEEENQNNFAILPDMVFIEGGTFQMGSDDYEVDEKPVHNVKLSSFKLAKFEVTQMLWEAVMKYNPSHFKADRLPVETVSWDAVQEFLVEINSMTGNNYRLTTEAEWEYAARGGNKSNLSKFSGSNNLNDIAWYDGNSEDKTHIVGSLKPNELGLFDMSGNVWEWCSDRYGDSYYKNSLLVNPIGMKFGSNHIFRGGSYTCSSNICHVSHRFKGPVNAISYGLGFRLAMSVN